MSSGALPQPNAVRLLPPPQEAQARALEGKRSWIIRELSCAHQMVLVIARVQTVRISQAFKEFVKNKTKQNSIFSVILRRTFCG